jgi:hypothetical protein
MTRITQRHLIQQVDDKLVFIDEFTGVEVVKPIAEAQIVLDHFRTHAENNDPMVLTNVDDDEDWFLPPEEYPAVERALNYFIDSSGVRQARALDASAFESGE